MPEYELKIWQIPSGKWGWRVRTSIYITSVVYEDSEKKARQAAAQLIQGWKADEKRRDAEGAAEWEPINA